MPGGFVFGLWRELDGDAAEDELEGFPAGAAAAVVEDELEVFELALGAEDECFGAGGFEVLGRIKLERPIFGMPGELALLGGSPAGEV